MKINLNTETSNSQNFGMAIHSNELVNKALKARIKTTAELDKLNKIIDKQAKNDKVDISLFVMQDGESLSGNVYARNTEHNVFKQYTENALTKLFEGPVGFIEKLAKVADKEANKLAKLDNIKNNSVFDKMQ